MSNIAPSFTESPSFTKSETSKPLTLMDDMLNNPKPINLISKNTCSHQDNKCNHLKPFSMLELHGKEKFTLDEKKENLRKYKLSCSNRGGKYTQCCDKYDKNLDEVVKKLNMPELKGKVEYNRHGKLSSIKLCKGKNCPKDYKPLSTYERCKLGQDYHKNEEDGVIKKFNPDCFLTQCNPQEKVPDILGTISENYTYEMDKQMSAAIQKNNLQLIKYYIQKDPSLKLRVLTHNKEGNTIFHETLKYNSGNNLYYIFKLAGKEIAFTENMKGDTVLHMAMRLDNKNAIMFCIKLGCDMNEKNNDGQTPIYYAIKNNLIDNVRIAINHLASLETKDKNGDTPLLFSLNLEVKNVDIVRLLVERGSSTKVKNSLGKTPLEIIHAITNPKVEDEEVRTYLEQVRLKNMGIVQGEHKLNLDQTRKVEGIAYDITGEEALEEGQEPNFKVSIEFTENDEVNKYYPDDLDENYMQPHKPGDKNLSHEPYFSKFKHLQKDKLKVLKDTILLTKWDNKNSKDKKLKIIDDIMEGKTKFDSYKYEVLNDNGIITEQEHMLFNNHSPGPAVSDTVTLQVKGPDHEPYNIFVGDNENLLESSPTESYHPAPSQMEAAEQDIVKSFTSPVESYNVPPSFTPSQSNNLEEIDRDLFQLLGEFIDNNSYNLLILAVIVTICIVVFLYMKSQQKDFFKVI